MKIIWEPEDIESGIIVCKPPGENKLDGWFCKWTLKVCYEVGRSTRDEFRLTAIISDGPIAGTHSAEELAAYFTKEGLVPIRKEWLVEAIGWARLTNGII